MAFATSAPAESTTSDAGDSHSCAIRADGELACWGDDSSGQLEGIPTGGFIAVSAGGAHSCAIRVEGQLACWGDDSSGQLEGIPTGEFIAVSAGGAHSCAIRVEAQLACWGDDSSGQASGGGTAFHRHRHRNDRHHRHDKDEEPRFAAVSAGGAHTCAIALDGDLVCWGESSPVRDGSAEGVFASVSSGAAHSCAIDAAGLLTCWGEDSEGQLADIPEGEFDSVSAGGVHSCAVRPDGEPTCWGNNGHGQVQPDLTGPEPPTAVIGVAYEHWFTTTPQAPAPAFLMTAGAIPEGLALDSDGRLAGLAAEAGSYDFTLSATNGVTPDPEREFSLDVVGSPLPVVGEASGITTSSAVLAGSVDPRNLPAEAWFEYWPAGSPPAGAERTEVQSVASGLLPVDVPAQISGLRPDTEYEYGLLAMNELGSEPIRSEVGSLRTAAMPAIVAPPALGLPAPKLGQTVNVVPAGGIVRTKCAAEGFTPLVSAEQIPITCLIDTRRGTVDLTTATAEPETQSGMFWGGVFRVSQVAVRKWATDLKLSGPRRCEQRKPGAAVTSRRRGGGRGLWGSGKGDFKTSGRYGSASVRGTTWFVKDRCDNSTLFAVAEGTVRVRDFVEKKSLLLAAGERYVARAAIARLP